ncbi:MAG: hypothetical protein NTW17_03545 [Candidatus Pacearchaeota archaeon]|nr:hypothetical protein [Candidatus Pacearchaeota archaeon]
MAFLFDPQEIFTLLGNPVEECKKRFPEYICNAKLREYIEKYEQAGKFQRFLWAIDPIDNTRLEALAARKLLEEREENRGQWLRSIELERDTPDIW